MLDLGLDLCLLESFNLTLFHRGTPCLRFDGHSSVTVQYVVWVRDGGVGGGAVAQWATALMFGSGVHWFNCAQPVAVSPKTPQHAPP